MAWIIEQVQPAGARDRPQQDAGRAALQRVPRVLPRQRGRVLRLLLRLLPARGVRPVRPTSTSRRTPRINDDIDRLRHAATSALFARRDVVIVASVSCIYGLGSPEEYARARRVPDRRARSKPRDESCASWSTSSTVRNDVVLGPRPLPRQAATCSRSSRRTRRPPTAISLLRRRGRGDHALRPADRRGARAARPPRRLPGHPVRDRARRSSSRAIAPSGRAAASASWREFEARGQMLEAHRLRQRTEYDLEMMQELGFCNGIENYSRILDGRAPGSPPHTLLDYFPDDFRRLRRRVAPDGARRSAACTRATARASRRWSTSASGSRRRSTTGRCASTSSSQGAAAACSSRRPRARASCATRPASPSSSSARPGSSTPRSSCARPGNQIDDLLDEIRRARGGGRARARHDADEEDVRGPDRLPARGGGAGALPALRDRHARADPDHPRPAPRRVRRARRRQPAARGPRPARGLAGRDPRRRQGGLPARPDGAHPDDRARRPQRQRPGAHVRRQA